MADIVFWIIVGLTIGSALMVVQSKSLLYSAYAPVSYTHLTLPTTPYL